MQSCIAREARPIAVSFVKLPELLLRRTELKSPNDSARGHITGNCGGCFGRLQRFRTESTNHRARSQRLSSQLPQHAFLRQSLTDRSDFRDVTIAEPTLRPVGPNQHYVVCVQFNPRGQIKTTKAVVYLSGQMTQFIDATPEQCADAVYQPFKELEAATPSVTSPSDLSDPRGMH
jgi:hypothetical protein